MYQRFNGILSSLSALTTLLVMLSGCTMIGPTDSDSIRPDNTETTTVLPVEEAVVEEALVKEALVKEIPAASEPPAEDKDLWRIVRSQFTLPRHLDRKRVQRELRWLEANPEYIARVTKRASRYLYHIKGEIEARGMPMEIALLPVVESAFDPYAYSHGRASGLWQFIPSTARLYGLKIDWWYDGRRDVVQSTTAALDYLEYLAKLYDGNWMLALAAYNSGQGNVNAAIRKNRRLGREEDFWSLPVPRETSAYVPRLLAVVEMVSDPVRYGATLHPIKNEPIWTIVDIGSQTDLTIAADLTAMDQDEFYQLNAGYNQWATHPDGPHRLLISTEHAAAFEDAIAKLPQDQRLTFTRHKIRSGESLGVIARRYKVSIDSLRSSNNIRGNIIVAGDYLMVPVAKPEESYPMTADSRLSRSQAYFEKKYGPPVTHTVKTGESFWTIARQYGVGMRELARWNGKGTTSLLRAGETLVVFNAKSAAKTNQRPMVRKVNYRVRRGESLSLIANRFNVSVNAIKSWNTDLEEQSYIHPGDRLTLYVDISATE